MKYFFYVVFFIQPPPGPIAACSLGGTGKVFKFYSKDNSSYGVYGPAVNTFLFAALITFAIFSAVGVYNPNSTGANSSLN